METNTKMSQVQEQQAAAVPVEASPAAVLAELVLEEAPVSGAPREEKQSPQLIVP
ncbi:hypothetical protein [Actinomadura sp. KC216]|uniref:hypothetical protein n=1 Tax=Actinomadura sp. KC216 TaxID=2530370 RepID=UPI001404BE8B|nr:hypothetical protein [Actinomadura sp. KC216]